MNGINLEKAVQIKHVKKANYQERVITTMHCRLIKPRAMTITELLLKISIKGPEKKNKEKTSARHREKRK